MTSADPTTPTTPNAPTDPSTPIDPVRWGYLGAGFIATEALVPAAAATATAALVAVAARSAERAQALVPDGRAYDDYAALIADPEVEAVYISLTNDVHLTWAVRALESGKHVLCEKPLAMTAAEALAMAQAAERSGRLLVEAVWTRWHPRTVRAIELLSSGRFGTPTAIESAFTFRGVDPGNFRWRPEMGGGALYDLGAYAVASSLWLTGWPPVDSVDATARWAEGGVDAATTARLRLGGAEATVRVSIDDDEEQKLVVRTDRGSIEFSAPAFTSHHQASTLTARLDDGTDELVEQFEPVDPYAVMLDHVSRAIRGDRDAWVMPLSDSLRVAELLDAVRAAAETSTD